MAFKFTDEQQAAIDLTAKRIPFSVVASAGSGKSATAVGMGAQLKGLKVLYLCYNTQARLEAERKFKSMPWVHVRTTSQIAWRAYADTHKERMNPRAEHVPAGKVAQVLKLTPMEIGEGLTLDGYEQARLALDAVDRFCNNDKQEISFHDVPLEVLGMNQHVLDAIRKEIAKLAQRLWDQTVQPHSKLRFTMNHAFKLVAMSNFDYGYDIVIVDEAQDSNDATMRFVANQKSAVGIMIGDPAQALYAWRGATDQILRHKGPRLHLTQSFRFGQAVAEEAEKHLLHTGTDVRVRGLASIKDQVSEGDMANPNVVLTRSNAGAMEWAMSYLATGKRVAMVRGTEAILDLAYAAAALMKGERPKSLELAVFETWPELVSYTDEPGGGHLKPLVRLVQAHGVHTLIEACKKMTRYTPKNPTHDVAVTTCHSIKGLEWERVQIADDFREPDLVAGDNGEMTLGPIKKDEAMIHYVAVTRAQRHLDRHGLAWIDKYDAPPVVTDKVPAAVGNA